MGMKDLILTNSERPRLAENGYRIGEELLLNKPI